MTTSMKQLEKLENEIAALHARLDTKLEQRRALLAKAIENGEAERADINEQVRSLSHVVNMVANGRVFTDEQIRTIRKLHKEGVSQCELGRRYGVAQPNIHKIVKRMTYADVK